MKSILEFWTSVSAEANSYASVYLLLGQILHAKSVILIGISTRCEGEKVPHADFAHF